MFHSDLREEYHYNTKYQQKRDLCSWQTVDTWIHLTWYLSKYLILYLNGYLQVNRGCSSNLVQLNDWWTSDKEWISDHLVQLIDRFLIKTWSEYLLKRQFELLVISSSGVQKFLNVSFKCQNLSASICFLIISDGITSWFHYFLYHSWKVVLLFFFIIEI